MRERKGYDFCCGLHSPDLGSIRDIATIYRSRSETCRFWNRLTHGVSTKCETVDTGSVYACRRRTTCSHLRFHPPQPRLLVYLVSTYVHHSLHEHCFHAFAVKKAHLSDVDFDRTTFLTASPWMSKAANEAISLEEAFESYCDGVSVYGPIWNHQLEYLKASVARPQCMMFLRYEEMIENPVSEVFSFDSLKDLEVKRVGELKLSRMMKIKNQLFFNRGLVGVSKRWLMPELIGWLDGLTEFMMGAFGSPSICENIYFEP
ncbi:Cytosolic sulfotransferase 17 [Acorus calamus]|uniref:Sulfotransferase n=1 Tax=Acorus calamus TaxID=4465 RepID=A0AAV9FLI0_ACOCL|nr:Cytosolic sulfotransferase 17 [Acorus calamus]